MEEKFGKCVERTLDKYQGGRTDEVDPRVLIIPQNEREILVAA